MSRMGKTEEDWNGLKLGFLKTVQPNSFLKLIPAACNFKNNAQKTYLFVSSLWFCHLHFHSDGRRVIGKIKQNELDRRDTAPLTQFIWHWSLHYWKLTIFKRAPNPSDCTSVLSPIFNSFPCTTVPHSDFPTFLKNLPNLYPKMAISEEYTVV